MLRMYEIRVPDVRTLNLRDRLSLLSNPRLCLMPRLAQYLARSGLPVRSIVLVIVT